MNSALLEGRVSLVTGASRGIGAAIARAFGRHGAAVAVNYRSNNSAAKAVVDDIENSGSRALAVAGDAGDEEQVAAIVERVTEELGDIDALVCNAAGRIVERYLAGESLLDSAQAIRERVITQLDSTLHPSTPTPGKGLFEQSKGFCYQLPHSATTGVARRPFYDSSVLDLR